METDNQTPGDPAVGSNRLLGGAIAENLKLRAWIQNQCHSVCFAHDAVSSCRVCNVLGTGATHLDTKTSPPPSSGVYLAFNRQSRVWEPRQWNCDEGGWYSMPIDRGDLWTHWMHMPEPPNESSSPAAAIKKD